MSTFLEILKFIVDTAAYAALVIIILTYIYIRNGNEITLSWQDDDEDDNIHYN